MRAAMRFAGIVLGVLVTLMAFMADLAEAKDIKLCLIISKTGDFADSAKEVEAGFMIGAGFATKGTLKLGDDKISIVVKDDQLKPDVGKALLAECYDNDKADIAVGSGGPMAAAMLPIAEQRKKILIALTGRSQRDNANRYVFYAEHWTLQDGLAEIAVIPENEDVFIGMLNEDDASSRYRTELFTFLLGKLRPNAKVVAKEYAPSSAASVAPYAERLFTELKDRPGKRLLALIWTGADDSGPEPIKQLVAMKPERFNITLAPRAMIRYDLDNLKSAPGAEGSIFYYSDFPKNPANDWLKSAYQKYSKSPPDFFAVVGFAAASAAITAMARAGSTDTEKLIATMEGMSFETPKGAMSFRKEDHQVLQDMYHWRMGKRGQPELVRTIPADEVAGPFR